MVEFRPAGLGVWFRLVFCWVVVVVLVIFSTIRLTFPPFNDDLGTMPTRRPYSWKKNSPLKEIVPKLGVVTKLIGSFFSCVHPLQRAALRVAKLPANRGRNTVEQFAVAKHII